MTTSEIATRDPGALAVRYELEVEDLIAQVQKVQRLMASVMRDGEHYGVIPGTKKPSLLKPGAEKLVMMFRLDPQYQSTETMDGKHLTVKTTCTLWHIPTGQRWGSGEGSCSTKESKYAYREGKRLCPTCGADAILRSKYPPRGRPLQDGPGWYCYKKRGGCGQEFEAGDVAITGQTIGRVPNEDVADQYNTVLKMSNKRALVAAVLNVTAASDIFTQDMEDMTPTAGPRASGEVIEAEATSVQPDDAPERLRLLQQIDTDAKFLGLTKAQYTVAWAKCVGSNVSEDAATLEQLQALARHYETKIANVKGPVTAEPDVPF